jgi:hypothetical protein
VPADKVQFALENLLNAFNGSKQDGEEFNTWVRRHDDATLNGLLGVETIVGAPDTREFHDDISRQGATPAGV